MKWLLALGFVLPLAAGEKIEVLRDGFGVPHIFARTEEGAMFASGYLQAEDRLEELHTNFRKALGTMAEANGEEWLKHDLKQRMWEHARIGKRGYPQLPAKVRSIIEAYTAGIEQYKKEHPGRLKQPDFRIEPWHVVAYGRYTVWRWHEGDSTDDLRRGGLQPDPLPYVGSNQMLIAPSRTAMHAPIAVIDPHLSWYGETRYWEVRMYGGRLAYSGGARLGLPFPTLGHSRNVSIAMTTGGPDTGDVFEESIKDGKYLFKGDWKPLRVETEVVKVRGAEDQQHKFTYTHHGPVWAHKDGKAYSMSTPYATEFRLVEQAWAMITARNLADMRKALDMRQYMAQNIMVGTTDGDIFYLRNGRVPVRAKDCDPSKPMPGDGSCEWLGVHATADLVQVLNPPQGYMQNNNVTPCWMMMDSPLRPEKWSAHSYLYNNTCAPPHQRAAMTLEQLHAAKNVTAEQAIELAFSPQVHKAATWQARIRGVSDSDIAKLIVDWDGRSEADSRGALAFYFFKKALGKHSRAVEPPADLSDGDIRSALRAAQEQLAKDLPPNATYGTYFRVGRKGSPRTFPVGGGSLLDAGMATPRAVTFEKNGNLMLGIGGQTQTQVVVLSKPPKSWMILPLGESDDPDSPHFDDQAEKLFSPRKAKPTYFDDRAELEKHVTTRKTLIFGQ